MSRVFSDDELISARRQSGKPLKTSAGKPYFPRRKHVKPEVKAETKEPVEEAISEQTIAALLTVAKASEANTAGIIATQGAILDMMQEMHKPKPKKTYRCHIERNAKGEIIPFNVEEV